MNIPKPGEIWVKIEEDRDNHNRVGGRVRIVPGGNLWPETVAWDYIPSIKTQVSRMRPYQNSWNLENFVMYYRRDETYEVERLLEQYEKDME